MVNESPNKPRQGEDPRRDDAAPYAAKSRGFYQTLGATSIGLEMAAAVLIGLFFGRWLDGKIGTEPWMMLVFLVLGFAAGMKGVMRFARVDKKNSETGESR